MRPFFLIFSLLVAFKSIACDCGYNGPFMEMAPKTKLVALVQVVKYSSFSRSGEVPHSIEVEVLEVFKGKESRKRIIIWGDNGYMCRPFISHFSVDSVYVMALYAGQLQNGHTKEAVTDYSVSNCGLFWLQANKELRTATGHIFGENRRISIMPLGQLRLELSRSSR